MSGAAHKPYTTFYISPAKRVINRNIHDSTRLEIDEHFIGTCREESQACRPYIIAFARARLATVNQKLVGLGFNIFRCRSAVGIDILKKEIKMIAVNLYGEKIMMST